MTMKRTVRVSSLRSRGALSSAQILALLVSIAGFALITGCAQENESADAGTPALDLCTGTSFCEDGMLFACVMGQSLFQSDCESFGQRCVIEFGEGRCDGEPSYFDDMGMAEMSAPREDLSVERGVSPPPRVDMSPDPPACDLPPEGRCVGTVIERCGGGAERFTFDCAANGEICVVDEQGAHCESQAPVDPCAAETCSGRGWCDNGSCLCDPGYAGARCDSCDGIWSPTDDGSCRPAAELLGTGAADELSGGDGAEFIQGRDADDTLRGGGGNDLLQGNKDSDSIEGNMGRDQLNGGAGNDLLFGGDDGDALFGDLGHDSLRGGRGNDRLVGGDGDDLLQGAGGDDHYTLDGLGDDTVIDPEGNNSARCLPGVRVVGNDPDGEYQRISFSTGGSLKYKPVELVRILGCDGL